MKSSMAQRQVAVLYQALELPLINGVKKTQEARRQVYTRKHVLKTDCQVSVVLPIERPNAAKDGDWCFRTMKKAS